MCVTDEAPTFQLLVESILERHRELKREHEAAQDVDYVDFSELEIRAMIESLWVDRFGSSRQRFHEAVGDAVSAQIEKS